jgi:hypothetical protein
MTEPTDPGWRPEYTGDTSLGNVGSGRRLGAHLYYLYRAGRNEIPGVAAIYGDLTRQVTWIRDAMRELFDLPGRGMTAAHTRLLDLHRETSDVLRLTCLRMQEVGEALVKTADSYARTDEEAADEFSRLLDKDADDYRTPPPEVVEPPHWNESRPITERDDPHLIARTEQAGR